MLDFYIIKDLQLKPMYPEEINLQHIGGMNYKTFLYLQKTGMIEYNYEFHTDFRWDTDVVNQKFNTLLNIEYQNNSELNKLLELLKKPRNLIVV